MMKNQKGITLIALVITIIVLLILAGVSIAMLTGENGILSKATDAVSESEIADAKETAQLDVNAAMADYYDAKYTKGSTATNFLAYITALTGDDEFKSSDEKKYTVDLSDTGKEIKLTVDSSITGAIGTNGGITWSDSSAE